MKRYPTLRDANIARAVDFQNGAKVSAAFRGLELGGEVGEAQNVMKKLERLRLGMKGEYDKDELIKKLKEELADVIICVDLIAMDFSIDLTLAVMDKFNKTSAEKNLDHWLQPGFTL